MFSLQQNWRRGQNKFCLEARRMGERGRRSERGWRQGIEMAQTMYAYMNKKKRVFL
jgi:hypothetical protein